MIPTPVSPSRRYDGDGDSWSATRIARTFIRRAAGCRLDLAVNLIQRAAAVEMAAQDVASMKPMELGYPAPCVV